MKEHPKWLKKIIDIVVVVQLVQLMIASVLGVGCLVLVLAGGIKSLIRTF